MRFSILTVIQFGLITKQAICSKCCSSKEEMGLPALTIAKFARHLKAHLFRRPIVSGSEDCLFCALQIQESIKYYFRHKANMNTLHLGVNYLLYALL